MTDDFIFIIVLRLTAAAEECRKTCNHDLGVILSSCKKTAELTDMLISVETEAVRLVSQAYGLFLSQNKIFPQYSYIILYMLCGIQ